MLSEFVDKLLGLTIPGQQMPALSDRARYVMPEGATVIDLEKMLPQPLAHRYRFDTSTLEDFVTFVSARLKDGGEDASGRAGVFLHIDSKKWAIKSTFIDDIGVTDRPVWPHRTARLELIQTPAFMAFKQACDTPVTQREFVDWCLNWLPHLEFRASIDALADWPVGASGELSDPPEPDDSILPRHAVSRFQKLKVDEKSSVTHAESNYRASRSAFDEIDLQSGDEALPALVIFRDEVFEGLPISRRIPARIVATFDDRQRPFFRLRPYTLDDVFREIAANVSRRIGYDCGMPHDRIFNGSLKIQPQPI